MSIPRLKPRALVARIALLGIALFAFASPSAALAEEGESTPVSWSVTPAGESGPDGRTSVQHELDPGESVQDRIAVRNLGAEDIVFRLSAADGYYNSSGRFDMLPSGQPSEAAGAWIDIPAEVAVPAGGTVVVPFTITVPEDAEPGDHAAGVAASVLSVQQADGTGVGVESRVGVKVIAQVTGEIAPAFAVTGLDTDYLLSWNPFRPGNASVEFSVENTGNVRLDAAGILGLAGQQIAFPADGERSQIVLPGESRTFALMVDDVWPLIGVSGGIQVTPTASTADGEALDVAPRTVSLFIWAMPWPQLLVVVGLALVLWAIMRSRVRSRRRVESLIADAVERGREQERGERVPAESRS